MKGMNKPCAFCAGDQHNRCTHQWGSVWCTCNDTDCKRRRYNTAVRKAVDHANRLGLMVTQDATRADSLPALYDDIRVALIVPTGTAMANDTKEAS